MILGTNHRTKLSSLSIEITLNSSNLEMVDKFKYLGILIDPNLTYTTIHTRRMTAAASSRINTLSHIRKYVREKTALTIYKGMILPILDYANIVMSLVPKIQCKKLQRIQNRALRIIYSNHDDMNKQDRHITSKLAALEQRAANQTLCLMHRRSSAVDLFPHVDSLGITRSDSKVKFKVPLPKTLRSFLFTTALSSGMD